MEYLKIKYNSGAESIYLPAGKGEIEICFLSEGLNILKIYFPELVLESTNSTEFIDESTEVMLTNYPVEITNLTDLMVHNLKIEEGWPDGNQFTMLSIWDGEKIDENHIDIKRLNNDEFEVIWQGGTNEQNPRFKKLELRLHAKQSKDVVTPLCLDEEDLKRALENYVKK